MTKPIYESKLLLNRQKIFNPAEIHEALKSYLTDKTTREPEFFYRLEWYKIGVVVPMIMYSEKMPEMRRFPECQLLETRLLPELKNAGEVNFQLFVVPNFSQSWDPAQDEEKIRGWLQKELKNAAVIEECRFGPNNCLYFTRNEKECQQQTVTMKGRLTVKNALQLEEIRRRPMGKAIELGCGLLYLEEEKELAAD